jgi:hypothetical protein
VPNSNIQILEISVENVEQSSNYLQNFESENRGEEFWRTRLNHWWEDNPYSNPDLPRGWMLTEEGNENVIGVIGLIPLPYRVDGNDVIAYGATNWRINSDHRGAPGIRLLNQLRELSENHIVFDTSPTPGVEKLLRYADFQKIEQDDICQCTFIVNTQSNIKRLFDNRLWRAANRLVLGSANIILGPLAAGKLWDAAGVEPPKTDAQSQLANGALDDLWQRTQDLFAITKARTSTYLKWYCYGNERYRGKSLFVGGSDTARGIGIFYGRRVENLNDLYCLDLWPPNDQEAAVSIAVQAILHARRHGYDTVTLPFKGASKLIADRLSKVIMTVPSQAPTFGWLRSPTKIESRFNEQEAYFSKAEGDFAL